MAESVSVLLVSIAAVLTAIDQISIVLTTKKLWKQQQQLQQQLEMQYGRGVSGQNNSYIQYAVWERSRDFLA